MSEIRLAILRDESERRVGAVCKTSVAALSPRRQIVPVTENIGDRPVKRSVRAGMQNIRTGGTGLKSPISDGCGVCGKSRGEDCKKDSDE